MSASSPSPSSEFKDFCHRLCEAAGVAMPRLDRDGGTPPALGIDYHGVQIGLVQASTQDASAAVMLVDFGPAPAQRQAEVFRVLLESNFLMLGERAPAFGINPASGHVVYQHGFRIADADPQALCAQLDTLTATVMRWRETPLPLDDAAWAAPGPGDLAQRA